MTECQHRFIDGTISDEWDVCYHCGKQFPKPKPNICVALGLECDLYYDDSDFTVECARCGCWFTHVPDDAPPSTEAQRDANWNHKPRGPEIREIAMAKGYAWALED